MQRQRPHRRPFYRALHLEGLEHRLLMATDLDDSLSEARFLGAITTTPKTTSGSISPDIDVDMYRFTVTAGKIVDFDIDTSLNGPGGLGSFLRLFDAQGQQLAFNNDAAAPGEDQVGFDAYLRFTFDAAGTYYVGVSNVNNAQYDPLTGDEDTAGGQNSTGSYQLILQALPVDTDDSLSEASSLGSISTTVKTINAGISPDIDVDLYGFTVTAGRVVDFDIDTSLNGPGGLGSFLRLFDAQGQELDFNNDAAAPGENQVGFDAYLRFTFDTAGTYYVGVSNANNTLYDPLTGNGDRAGGQNSIGNYQLFVQALPVDTDDSLSEASSLGSISSTPKTINDVISPDIDVDLFRFTVSAGRVVDFDIDTSLNGPGGLGSFLRLFDAQGQELAFNNDAAAPGENQVGFDAFLRFTFDTAGTYYIGVSNANNTLYDPLTGNGDAAGGPNSIGSYQLIVQTAPVTPVDADDSLSEAQVLGAISTTPVTVNDGITSDIDVDLYRFTVAANQIVDFDIDTSLNGPGGLGSFLRLFDAQGQELAFNDDGAAPGENQVGFDAYLRFTFATAGTYYVGVSNANNTLYDPVTGNGDTAGGQNSIGNYQLIVQALPVDTDDSLGEARSLGAISTTPITVNDSIAPDIDVDLFRFTVAADQLVDFDIDTSFNGPGGLGSFLRLFNAQGQELAFNDDAAAPGENQVGFDAYLRFTFATAGTYYVGVSNANNSLYDPVTGNGDTAGGQNSIGSYQLIVQALPVDTDDSLSEAQSLGAISTTPVTVNDSITPDIDVDLYRFTVSADQTVDFDIDTSSNGPGGLGSFLRLFNAQGQLLAFNDDAAAPGEGQVGFDAYLRFTFAAAGTYFVGVSNANNTLYNPLTGDGDTAGGQNSIGSYQLIVQGLPTADVPTLTVVINVPSIPEFQGTAIGTVTRIAANLSQPLTVTLGSSNTNEATVPATVVIPANQTSVTFVITAVEDDVVDGTKTVTITASAAGFVGGAKSLLVTDSDSKWHNALNPLDVNDSGSITTNDALLIVNYLNRFGAGTVPTGEPPPYLDVSGDGIITAFDALLVVNFLNAQLSGLGVSDEAALNDDPPPAAVEVTEFGALGEFAPAASLLANDRSRTLTSRSFLRAQSTVVSLDGFFAEFGSTVE